MNKKTIKLTEAELHSLIKEAVESVIESEELEEGWFGDKWNQAKSAGNTMFQKGDMGIKDRFKNAQKKLECTRRIK